MQNTWQFPFCLKLFKLFLRLFFVRSKNDKYYSFVKYYEILEGQSAVIFWPRYSKADLINIIIVFYSIPTLYITRSNHRFITSIGITNLKPLNRARQMSICRPILVLTLIEDIIFCRLHFFSKLMVNSIELRKVPWPALPCD